MIAQPRIAIIGEAMLELSSISDGVARLSYGGDTFNTAIYMARLGWSPNYITALGTDTFSSQLLSTLQREGIQTDHVLRHNRKIPGLYAIETDQNGERQFHYWRSESAARSFFAIPLHEEALDFAAGADLLYLTGITLSIFGDADRKKIGELAACVQKRGGVVAFDPNYRPNGWVSTKQARTAIEDFAEYVTLAMPTNEDDRRLFGEAKDSSHIKRWLGYGAASVVLKCGPRGAIVASEDGELFPVPPLSRLQPVDTTGAGDAFNAAFIAARLEGASIQQSARRGNALAGKVIMHPGAIIPP